jgi:hypothetical protein
LGEITHHCHSLQKTVRSIFSPPRITLPPPVAAPALRVSSSPSRRPPAARPHLPADGEALPQRGPPPQRGHAPTWPHPARSSFSVKFGPDGHDAAPQPHGEVRAAQRRDSSEAAHKFWSAGGATEGIGRPRVPQTGSAEVGRQWQAIAEA